MRFTSSTAKPCVQPDDDALDPYFRCFTYLHDFLRTEFYRGLAIGNAPRRCHNCGRYFLLTAGYSTCCGNIAPGEAERTCPEGRGSPQGSAGQVEPQSGLRGVRPHLQSAETEKGPRENRRERVKRRRCEGNAGAGAGRARRAYGR